jgi:hypothetical protein
MMPEWLAANTKVEINEKDRNERTPQPIIDLF